VEADMLARRIFLLSIMVCGGVFGAEPIKPEEAILHVNEDCTIRMEVKASRLLEDSKICFLNSTSDYRDDKCFTVVIFSEGLEAFEKAGVKNPAEHFKGKVIEVKGTISVRSGKPQIKTNDPATIKVQEK
jgi:DNA/RNA endonuclease YhcR with UshA esterase domain